MYKNSIGIIQNLTHFFDDKEKELLEQMVEVGLETVQIQVWNWDLATEQNAEKLLAMLDGKLRVTSVWGGWSGPAVWNFIEGPTTLGLLPKACRAQRLQDLKKDADFAQLLGVHDMATHVGFVPEQPCDPVYAELVDAVKEIADYCGERGLHFNFETGQETPTALMRLLNDVDRENVGINLDPANLILYGKANPVDALDFYGSKIRGVHVKDGNYPKGNFRELGEEKQVGEGSVNFPIFLPKLLKGGYQGDLYIEREINGEERAADIKKTIKYLKTFLG